MPEELKSGLLTSPADALLREAIATTLRAEAGTRVEVCTRLLLAIEDYMRERPAERPWTCTIYRGTDGSTIYRGGIGHSLVIDPAGTLWKARSYEDFDTRYRFVGSDCLIDSLTPKYAEMKRYQL